jgi:uncharacterized membrane protein
MLPSYELVHLHLLLNHFPTVGLIVAVGMFVMAILRQSEELKQGSLAIMFAIALVALATYMTGYSAEKSLKNVAGVSQAIIDLHQRAALFALVLMEVTGVAAWFGLYSAHRGRLTRAHTTAMLVLSFATIGVMTGVANIGGYIRHPEILASPAAVPTSLFAPAWLDSTFITQYQYDHAWAWKSLESLHFMGLCLLFGVVTVVNMRLLGWLPNAPLDGMRKLLPWGVLGFGANTVTGMLFFIGQAFQYIENPAFHAKMLCILLAGADVLYLTWNHDVWNLEPGQTPPAAVKVLAASQVVLWIGVIYFGRMLPYIGDAF